MLKYVQNMCAQRSKTARRRKSASTAAAHDGSLNKGGALPPGGAPTIGHSRAKQQNKQTHKQTNKQTQTHTLHVWYYCMDQTIARFACFVQMTMPNDELISTCWCYWLYQTVS